MIDLKPCPFCGGKANVVFESELKTWRVKCEGCYASSEGWGHANASPEGLYYAIEEAVGAAACAWNRRADNEAEKEL